MSQRLEDEDRMLERTDRADTKTVWRNKEMGGEKNKSKEKNSSFSCLNLNSQNSNWLSGTKLSLLVLEFDPVSLFRVCLCAYSKESAQSALVAECQVYYN